MGKDCEENGVTGLLVCYNATGITCPVCLYIISKRGQRRSKQARFHPLEAPAVFTFQDTKIPWLQLSLVFRLLQCSRVSLSRDLISRGLILQGS